MRADLYRCLPRLATFNACLFAGIAIATQAQAQLPNPALAPTAPPDNNVFKTLDQVEPRTPINADNTPGNAGAVFVISSPGSYYLTGNVTGVSGKHGIEISSDDVTLDLSGFQLKGVAGSLSGISSAGATNARIINGTIRGWGKSGISAVSSFVVGWDIRYVRAEGNADSGIEIFNGTIAHCHASANSTPTGSGVGIGVNAGGAILFCTASSNNRDGISATIAAVTSCAARSNKRDGIVGANSTLSSCAAHGNERNGFTVSFGSRIDRCVSQFNDRAGIYVGSDASEARNHITGNSVIANNRGIEVDSKNNVITGNTSLDNTPDSGTTDTDYDIVAGNLVGTVVKLNMSSSAVVGNTGGGSGTTDPYANFSN